MNKQSYLRESPIDLLDSFLSDSKHVGHIYEYLEIGMGVGHPCEIGAQDGRGWGMG